MATFGWIARFRIAPWLVQVGVALGGGREAAAETTAAHLSYQAPAGCGSEREVLRQFHSLVGGELQGDSLDTRIVLERRGAVLVLEFEATYRDVTSDRTLEVEDCDSAIEAAAVLMLLTVDPTMAADLDVQRETAPVLEHREGPEPPLRASEPPSASQPGGGTRRTASSEPVPRRNTQSHASPIPRWLGMGASASSGATPEVALGGALEGGVSLRPVDLVLSFAGQVALPDEVADVAGTRVDASLWSAHARAQLRLRKPRMDFGPLVGLGVDGVWLSTSGVSSPGAAGTQWTSVRAGLFASAPPTGAWRLSVNTALVVPFQRPRYRVEGLGVIHRPSAVGFEAFFGVAWHWGSQS